MVEPLSKRRKRVETSKGIRDDDHQLLVDEEWEFRASLLDEFKVGRGEATGRGSRAWKGGFRGRPELIADLLPAIKLRHGMEKLFVFKSVLTALRNWWRFLDSCHDIAPVDRIEDIDDLHGALQVRDGVQKQSTMLFLSLVNDARRSKGLPRLYWPTPESPTAMLDLPNPSHIGAIYHELKRGVYEMFHRFEIADRFAEEGENWDQREEEREWGSAWSEKDIHATYRGFCARIGNPTASPSVCRAKMTMPCVAWTYNTKAAIFGRFPSRSDIQDCFCLFLLRTGWNASTALNINVEHEADWFCLHPTSPAHHIVKSVKSRGNTTQIAIGLNRSSLSPGNLLRFLAARTEPLREVLRSELSTLLAEPGELRVRNRIAELRRCLRSPWLFVSSKDYSKIQALDATSYALESQGRTKLHQIIRELNGNRPASDQIPLLALGDFRDAYISFAYEQSGYSWLVAQLAAGHGSHESLATYLRKRRWKAHGETKFRDFGNAMWREIEIHRAVDPAILAVWVQRGEVSDEQRYRWLAHKDRTRVGMGCRNFRKPPYRIAPDHIEGRGCRTQRCTLCEFGVVFSDSID
ncbi:TPA: hypothetical protein QDA88_005783, partial [Burkholderia vietnamiensis]|nr:hypothetical protein [Burkholderia vietnamiensis]